MKFLEKLKKASLEQVAMYIQAIWRHSATIGICLGLMWGMTVKVVKPYAQEAVVQMMKDAGVDPETFKGLIDDAKHLTQENDLIRGDLNTVKRQNADQIQTLEELHRAQAEVKAELARTQESVKKDLDAAQATSQGQINRIEKNLDKLLDAVINRNRADLSVGPDAEPVVSPLQ